MRKLLTFMLLAAAMLPALSQAQTVNICDRTPQVRDEIMLAIGASDCAAMTAAQLASIHDLSLHVKQLTTLRAGDFDGLTLLRHLALSYNQLTALPVGLFDGLINLRSLTLERNQLTTIDAGLFDGLTRLQDLNLSENQLTALPAGLFDNLIMLRELDLSDNKLARAGLPAGLFDGLTRLEGLNLSRNHLVGLSDHDPLFGAIPYVFLRGQTEPPTPPEEPPGGEVDSFANPFNLAVGGQVSGRIDPAGESDYYRIRVSESGTLTVYTSGGFDTVGYLYDSGERQLASNDDGGESRNFRIQREVDGGTYYVRVAAYSPNAIDSYTVHAALDASTEPEPPEEPETNAQRLAAAAPLMVSASDSMRQGFVRIINESEESGSVRILAFDDGGNAANPIEIQLGANQALHFNSRDLENGNAGKGIYAGVGSPNQGDWRLDIESALALRVLAFVRTTDGFLTAMGDVLQRNAEGLLVAQTFNPGSNANQVSKLRLVNTGANADRVSIRGVDDQGRNAGPVTLTLAAGESRTLSAQDLEQGAQGLTGTLGDGAGKWRLFITAGQAVECMSLLEAVSGHLTNISAMGVATEDQ